MRFWWGAAAVYFLCPARNINKLTLSHQRQPTAVPFCCYCTPYLLSYPSLCCFYIYMCIISLAPLSVYQFSHKYTLPSFSFYTAFYLSYLSHISHLPFHFSNQSSYPLLFFNLTLCSYDLLQLLLLFNEALVRTKPSMLYQAFRHSLLRSFHDIIFSFELGDQLIIRIVLLDAYKYRQLPINRSSKTNEEKIHS